MWVWLWYVAWCSNYIKSTPNRLKHVWNLCARWKANNFLLFFHFIFSFIFHFFFVCFRHHYGNEANVFICAWESIPNESTTSERSHPIFFSFETSQFILSLSLVHESLTKNATNVCFSGIEICFQPKSTRRNKQQKNLEIWHILVMGVMKTVQSSCQQWKLFESKRHSMTNSKVMSTWTATVIFAEYATERKMKRIYETRCKSSAHHWE